LWTLSILGNDLRNSQRAGQRREACTHNRRVHHCADRKGACDPPVARAGIAADIGIAIGIQLSGTGGNRSEHPSGAKDDGIFC
jgi:hypothetical protein